MTSLILALIVHFIPLPPPPQYDIPGVGRLAEGAGLAVAHIDNDPRPDIILMAYDAPSGSNTFRYKIAWNVDSLGKPTSVSPNYIQLWGVGSIGQGAGLAVGYIDANPRPDAIFMGYDAPSGPNTFRYYVGWNLDTSGLPASTSPVVQVAGVGYNANGASAALVNLDSNLRPELVLMAYDSTSPNDFAYRVGWNIGTDGLAVSWGEPIRVTGFSNGSGGVGVAFGQLDSNRLPDMLLMSLDNVAGVDPFVYKIGFNVGPNGQATSWSGTSSINSGTDASEGGDAALFDIDQDGRADLFLLANVNDPVNSNYNYFRYILKSGVGYSDVAVSAPASGSTVSDYATITITTVSTFSMIELLIDGTVASVLAGPPYTFRWDTLLTSNGPHQLRAKATDNVSKETIYSVVSPVTVYNAPCYVGCVRDNTRKCVTTSIGGSTVIVYDDLGNIRRRTNLMQGQPCPLQQ